MSDCYQPMSRVEAEQLAADINATGKCQAWAKGDRNGFIGEMWVVLFWTPNADEVQRATNRDHATRYHRILGR